MIVITQYISCTSITQVWSPMRTQNILNLIGKLTTLCFYTATRFNTQTGFNYSYLSDLYHSVQSPKMISIFCIWVTGGSLVPCLFVVTKWEGYMDPPQSVASYCCSHFLVSRSRINGSKQKVKRLIDLFEGRLEDQYVCRQNNQQDIRPGRKKVSLCHFLKKLGRRHNPQTRLTVREVTLSGGLGVGRSTAENQPLNLPWR